MTAYEKIDKKAAKTPDDAAMLRAAVDLTRDLSAARPGIYWPDMLISAVVGYAALAGAILLENGALAVASGVVFGQMFSMM